MPTPYKPTSATEGDLFESRNCIDCIFYPSGNCDKITRAMLGGQPRSWIKDENGIGVCTAKRTNRDKRNLKQPKNQTRLAL